MKLDDLRGALAQREEYRRAFAEEDLIHRVAERVLRHRKVRGLTQDEVAERLDTHQPAIARIEGGYENLTLRSLARLAWALDCRPEDLIMRETPLQLLPGVDDVRSVNTIDYLGDVVCVREIDFRLRSHDDEMWEADEEPERPSTLVGAA